MVGPDAPDFGWDRPRVLQLRGHRPRGTVSASETSPIFREHTTPRNAIRLGANANSGVNANSGAPECQLEPGLGPRTAATGIGERAVMARKFQPPVYAMEYSPVLTLDGDADAAAWRAADRAEAARAPEHTREACGMRGCAARAAGRARAAQMIPGGMRPGAATGSGLMRMQESGPFLRELRAAADLHGRWVASDLHANNAPRAFPLGRWGLFRFSAAWAFAAPRSTPPGALAEIASTIFASGPAAAGYVVDGANGVGILVPAGATGTERAALARAASDLGLDSLPAVPFAGFYN